MMTNSKIHSNVHKFLIFQSIGYFFLSIPVIVLFWQENGLTFTEIMILQSLFSIVVIFSEVPTGAFADFVSRKSSLMIGAFSHALGMFIYSIGHNFWQFLIAESIFAIGVTFISGADSAFLYDTLAEEGKENQYKKIYGNIFGWTYLSSAVAVILGGIIGKFSLRLTLALQVPIFLIAFLVALTFKEPKHKKPVYDKGYLHHIYKSARFALIKNTEVRWLVLYAAIISTAGRIGLWFYQPYMKLSGLDIFYFGVAFALFNVVAALSSKFAHNIEDKVGRKIALILPTIFLAAGLLLFGSVLWIWGFIFGFLLQFVRGFASPVIEDYINKIVWSDKRATIMSLSNLLDKLLFAAAAPFIGFFADKYSLQQALLLSGATVLIIGTALLLFMKKDKVFEEVS